MNCKTLTIIQYEKKLSDIGKKTLYLVLKPKEFSNEIIDSIQAEIERRFNNFLRQISSELKNTKFQDEENSIKYIMLKAISEILNKMLNERKILLSPKDKIIIDNIFEDEKKSIEENEEKNNLYPNSFYNNTKKNGFKNKDRE